MSDCAACAERRRLEAMQHEVHMAYVQRAPAPITAPITAAEEGDDGCLILLVLMGIAALIFAVGSRVREIAGDVDQLRNVTAVHEDDGEG